MDDEEFLAARIVSDVGIVGLALLVLLNAGGLALMVATGGSYGSAWMFLLGTFCALLAMLISYLLAQSAAARGDAYVNLLPNEVLLMQLVPALVAAILFFWGAVRVLQSL